MAVRNLTKVVHIVHNHDKITTFCIATHFFKRYPTGNNAAYLFLIDCKFKS